MKKIDFNYRVALAFGHDFVASAVAWLLAFWIRFNLDIPKELSPLIFNTLMYVVPLQAILFWKFGLYRGIWRYASIPDLQRILLAVIVAALAVPTLLVLLRIAVNVPRAIFILDPILLILIMGGSRLAYRAWREHRLYGVMRLDGEPVLVLGTGDAAVNLLKDANRSKEYRVVGLLDDDSTHHGLMLQGVRVLGKIQDIASWANKFNVKYAIIAMPEATASMRRKAVEAATAAGLTVMTVPAIDDLLSGKVTISEIRKIELEDLLGREQVALDSAGLHQLLMNKTVMVTGAGGSIGSELCRQIARFRPQLIVLFELNEFALYSIEQEFNSAFPNIAVASIIGDVKDAKRVNEVFLRFKPIVIFHAAAYKHVPLMESENAVEALNNNVLGTWQLAKAAVQFHVDKFVLISTDKAVNPTNVMGATKRLAELVCQNVQQTGATRFVTVRFGNVLGSTGSVIPKFREQIAKGGPITVTHPEITRYFMSIPEASQLVLQAGLMGKGGEIFVLDMGEPIKILDLARDMIKLSGFSEDEIKIVFTGLRPGEKLYEELLADGESTLPTPHPKLRIAKASNGHDNHWLNNLLSWVQQISKDVDVKQGFKKWLPEYQPVNEVTSQNHSPASVALLDHQKRH